MFAERLRRLRLARGMTLDELSAHLGGAVTKQALSKYEKGDMRPSSVVLTQLARVFGMKSAALTADDTCMVEFVAYRKGSGLTPTQQSHVEAFVAESLQQRVRLQGILGDLGRMELPKAISIRSLEDCEAAAATVREEWNLGTAPISNLVMTLESRRVHVIEVETADKFDGVSARALCNGEVVAAATASRKGVCGDRQRLTLAHELGHLVLKVPESVDEEKAAYRFGSALLAPADEVKKQVGAYRSSISVHELLALKPIFGISAQALLYRLADLRVVSKETHKAGCIQINRMKYRLKEPNELPPEKPQWLELAVLRARSEKLLSADEQAQLLDSPQTANREIPNSALQRREFAKLPLEQRRQLLAEQASKVAAYYEGESGFAGLGGGDFL